MPGVARIPLPEPEDLRGWRRAQHERFPSHLTRTLVLLDERLARALPDTANALRAAHLDAQWREGIILRVAALTGSAYERAQHLDQAYACGWTEDQVRAIETTGDVAVGGAALPAGFAVALELVDACVAGRPVTDALLARVRGVLSDQDLVTVIVLVGHYVTVARLTGVLGLLPDGVAGPWDREH
ncbi:carboxymuconolactone decarboxylase family protein [Actinokineospora bangkokensis]|uniref:Carboxymuconolactone decarboxylase-like domain-containing protein n=1 Tax=Actinokineospora bangkokensis TaxID=1193682 RepID=A0A1Q9LLB3_9PSEU|nr:carboxymuconolactone decarboxylase family protein [Actinokineospora bangkokensis]OLR92794.1 hypothetical protein BJP25_19385 [Actinokineospora bangkokensis]